MNITNEMIEALQDSLGKEGVYVGDKTCLRALTDALRHAEPCEPVVVKPLEWKGMVPTAETIVGEYSISRIGGDWSVGLWRHGNSYDVKIASGEAPLFEIALIEAKAAAQQDYSARILSALEFVDAK